MGWNETAVTVSPHSVPAPLGGLGTSLPEGLSF